METEQAGQQFPPTIIHQGDKADLLEKIRPDEIVEIIRNKLMGKDFVDGRWEYLPELKNRGLTFIGAWEISNLMLPVSSRNVSISKLNEDFIKKRTLNICKTAQKMMLDNWREYGIKSSAQLHFVHELIISNTSITLRQPEGEGIRKMLMGTLSESRNYIGEQTDPNRSKLRGLFRRR